MIDRLLERLRTWGRRALRGTVGDRTGAAIFLGSLVLFGLTWRIGVFVSDTYTVADAMVAVADGHLYVDEVVYDPTGTGDTPRMHFLHGRLYGRNYGQIVASLPFLWALAAAARAADLGVVLPLCWSALLFAFAVSVGRSVDRPRAAAVGGGALAATLLVVNLAYARPVDPRWRPLMALQLSTMVAAALIGVVVYRLVARMHGRRVGAFAGVVAALGSPVGFWATIPKRHTVVALLALTTLYWFYRSREATDLRAATRYRALAYVPVGLTAWVFVPDAAVLFVALVAVDLPTARSNHPRRIALVGAVFLVSLAPAMATNALVSGNPLQPPVALPTYAGPAKTVAAADGAGGSIGGAGVTGVVVGLAVQFVGKLLAGVATLLDPGHLFHVFVRGNLELGLHRYGTLPVNLAVLEAMPLAGALLAAPVVLVRRMRAGDGQRAREGRGRRWRARDALRSLRTNPERATDALALAYLAVLVLAYLPRSLTYMMLTVRYLHPLYPLCAYLLVRLAFVRATVDREWRLLGGAYAAVLLAGGAVFALALASWAGDLGEAVQFNARVALAAAAALCYWSVVATLTDGYERLGAVSLAFAGATTTAFVLLAAFSYFPYGEQFALPVARTLAELLAL